MPSYSELMLAELQQQRSEQARQHGELLSAIATLAQATQRLEQALARLEAQPQLQLQQQAQAQQPVSAQAQGVAQVQPQAGAQGEGQTPPPAENLQSRPGVGRWGGRLLEVAKNAAKAILGKSAT
jgi:chromosome segregation ATPase